MLNVTDNTKQIYKKDGIHKELRIYFPELDLTCTNGNIVEDSFELYESLQASGNLEFVGCVSSRATMTLAGLTKDIVKKKVEIYVKAQGSDEEISLFKGVVDSAQKQSYKTHRDVVAYDIFYTLSQTNIATWYNNHNKTTISGLFNDLMEYLKIEVGNVSFINGHLPAYCAESQVAESLAALDVLKSICQINAVFGRINREGKFETISLDKDVNSAAFSIEEYEDMWHEEYIVKPIDSVLLRESGNDGGVSVGIGDENTYIIQGNMFTSDWTDSELTEVVNNIYTLVGGTTYIPFEADTYGLPYIECGDKVEFEDLDLSELVYTKKIFYMFTRTLTGESVMRDNFMAEGEETYSEFSSDVNTEIESIRSQMGEYNLIRFLYDNVRKITVSDVEEFLGQIDYETTVHRPFFLAEILINVEANKQSKSISATVNGTASTIQYTDDIPVEVSIRYVLNGETIDYYPVETYTPGKHILNLIYILGDLVDAGTFAIYMTVNGGTVTIDEYNLRSAIIGQGKASAAVEWDGTLVLEDNLPRLLRINNSTISMKNIRDDMILEIIDPVMGTFGDGIGKLTLNVPVIEFKNITDITEVVDVYLIEHAYTVGVDKASNYIYDESAVRIANAVFELNPDVTIIGSEESIDQGRMSVVEINYDDYTSVDNMEVRL